MTKGRTPPPLPSLTLPVSGCQVKIRPLGRMMLEEIRKAARKAHPAPEPPMNEVTGMDGKPTQEPNEADPEYLAALANHNNLIAGDVAIRVIKIAQAYDSIEFDADVAAVARVRKAMDAGGIVLDDDDRGVYLWHVLIDADEDMSALISALMRMSEVTEEAIGEAAETFPGKVPRP